MVTLQNGPEAWHPQGPHIPTPHPRATTFRTTPPHNRYPSEHRLVEGSGTLNGSYEWMSERPNLNVE